MAFRSNYWSCSNFADRLRGTPKPSAETGKGWDNWHKAAKSKHPIRYWLADEFLDRLQNFINWPLDQIYNLKYYAVNRWIDQSHALVAHPTHIKPGQWMDLSERVLYCLFDELVDFVEIEKAYSNYRWSEEKRKGMKWWQVGPWRTRTWRSAEAGIQHLEWEMTLTNIDWLDADKKDQAVPTHQAICAREIFELYTWWTKIRPARPDEYDASGWSKYCELRREHGGHFFDFEDDTVEMTELRNSASDKLRDIEKAYEDEDEEMLIRLIKIRKGLWT